MHFNICAFCVFLMLPSQLDCKSTHVLPLDGGWGRWSEWSTCSSTCGTGQQTRYRMCDNPTPNYGGAFCAGESFRRRHCDVICPELIPYTPLYSPTVDGKCACGCTMSQDIGEIIASGRCEHTSRWLINVPDKHVIKLRFNYLNLYRNQQWVRVRNGGLPDSDLIAFSDGRDNIDYVTSSTNQMLVEFYSEPSKSGNEASFPEYSKNATKPIHVHGFIATFSSNITSITTLAISAVLVNGADDEPSIWESTVTIVGISLCALVVITAVSFVVYHRVCHKRGHNYKMAAHEESPKRMYKSTSMRSTPSHESHHGIEIEHDMEIPLTGNANGGDKKKAKTPGSTRSKGSFSSACSNNIKKIRTKADVEAGSVNRSSPMTPQRDYQLVPQDASPRRSVLKNYHEPSHQTEAMVLFRTSPLIKPKVPRSPKVHPSSKLKHSDLADNVKTPVSGEYPSLKAKGNAVRQHCERGKDSQRIVMGSDYTPTNSVKSPYSESSKLECDTPTNINNGNELRKHTKVNPQSLQNSDLKEKIPNISDISLQDLNQTSEERDRNPASGTSDDSGLCEKEGPSQMTTSFIENGTKPRRPTSLTESYSKMSLSSILNKSGNEVIKDKTSVTSSDDRQVVLPKPDGQSPKSQRLETIKVEPRSLKGSPVKTSTTSTPRSVKSLRSDRSENSNNTKSPARSINTPSDVVELEYDDFIDMDDTYSYFDPIETEKLTWHGVERVIAKTPNKEHPTK